MCVISGLPSARLSPEGSRLLSYLRIYVACMLPVARAYMHSRYVSDIEQVWAP